MSGSKSITSVVYHLKYASEYMGDYRLSLKTDERANSLDIHRANQWVQKLDYLVNDIYRTLTPESKVLFQEEFGRGSDPIFYGAMTEKLQRMTKEQRELMETMADALLKGEEVLIEKID